MCGTNWALDKELVGGGGEVLLVFTLYLLSAVSNERKATLFSKQQQALMVSFCALL